MPVSEYQQKCIDELREELRLCEDCDGYNNPPSECPDNCNYLTVFEAWKPNKKTNKDGTSMSRLNNLLTKVCLSKRTIEEKVSMIVDTFKIGCTICHHKYSSPHEYFEGDWPCEHCRIRSMHKDDEYVLASIKTFVTKVSITMENERI